jgi:hypothetical protein
MKSFNYRKSKEIETDIMSGKKTNIFDLRQKAYFDNRKEKQKTVLYAALAAAALAASGFIISL